MTLRYSLSYADWCDYFDAITPRNTISPSNYYIFVLFTNCLLLFLAYLCFWELSQIFLGILALYFGTVNLYYAIPLSKHRNKAIKDNAATKTAYPITLDISDDGITETAFDIVSFCPWRSVKHIQRFKGMIIVHLSSGLYGVIPCLALESIKMSPDAFVSYLEQKMQA